MSAKKTISIAARLAEVNIETIRYYQRIGLIDEPEKPVSGFRVYPQSTINRIRFIQRAKKLGFSLAEIALLLELDDGNCTQTRIIAERKHVLITEKIKDLKTMAAVLETQINNCRMNVDTEHCPLISSLTDDQTTAKKLLTDS